VNETIEADAQTEADPTPEAAPDTAAESAPEAGEPTESAVNADSDADADAAPDTEADGEADGEADAPADPGFDSGSDSGSAAGDDSDSGTEEDGTPRLGRRERLEQEGDIAADYLEELLEITDLDGDLDMDVEGDRATVSIVGANLPQLVGPQGEVLEALQELTRLAVYRETGERSRLMLDVSGHRAERRTTLEAQAAEVVAQVKESGEQASLEPMSPFERKVVHDVVAAAGLKSESEGAEPRRYVVVLPA